MTRTNVTPEFVRSALSGILRSETDSRASELGIKNVYFVGKGLCLDIEDDVITFNHGTETYGFFSGKGDRTQLGTVEFGYLEQLMVKCNINFVPRVSEMP